MDVHLKYQLIRSKKRRKTISLQIKEDGKIVLYVPHRTPEGEIEKFFEKHLPWVSKKMAEKEGSLRRPKKSFSPDEKFFYLGEAYPLEIHEGIDGRRPLTLSFGKFILSQDCVEEARDIFIAWYKKEAKDRLAERVDYYSNRFQLFPKGLKITSAKSRWGSCSRDNRLCISWRIMMAPLNVIDYILIHELVHIKEKNHSRKFWNCVASLLPDYKKDRRWLRDHENLFCL
jgi:predicted metal-dependent hydrolase